MIFREITLEDMQSFDDYKELCSDFIFSYLIMYKDVYKLTMAKADGAVIIRSDKAAPEFYMPLGETEKGVRALLDYCRENNIKPVISKIPEGCEQLFADLGFHVEEDRDSFDYIFKNEDFLGFEGKDFRKQRNNFLSYLKNFTPEFTVDIKSNVDACREFTRKYHNTPDILEPTMRMLDNIDRFRLRGGIVLNQGEISAFCLYERVSEDMIISHVELTDNSHRGVHVYLINELAKTITEKFINKEDDMGLAGLRKFKETFNPHHMLKKYRAYLMQA